MGMSKLVPLAGVVLILAALMTIILPPDIWNPSLTVRLLMGLSGVLVLLFSVIGRRQPPS